MADLAAIKERLRHADYAMTRIDISGTDVFEADLYAALEDLRTLIADVEALEKSMADQAMLLSNSAAGYQQERDTAREALAVDNTEMESMREFARKDKATIESLTHERDQERAWRIAGEDRAYNQWKMLDEWCRRILSGTGLHPINVNAMPSVMEVLVARWRKSEAESHRLRTAALRAIQEALRGDRPGVTAEELLHETLDEKEGSHG
jgi:hypothetical protein